MSDARAAAAAAARANQVIIDVPEIDPETGKKRSKNEIKKIRKQLEKEAKKKAKAAAKAKEASNKPSKKKSPFGDDDADVEPWKYFENRSTLMTKLIAESTKDGASEEAKALNPYPHKFHVSHRIPDFRKAYEDACENDSKIEGVEVSVAGRIVSKRASGSKLLFYTLHGEGADIQVFSSLQDFEGGQAAFEKVHALVKRGDIVGITGSVGKSRNGELSIFPRTMRLLSPCLHMLPKAKKVGVNALTDQETRFRQRYLDLIMNKTVRRNFEIRAKIIKGVRKYLDERGYLEVETPMMNMIPGGATARPFVTHHNTLDIKMYMRIAPELYLKELIVGGLDRVYEIGRQFRNEGMDQTHNPEFTTCEFYQAYADYQDLIKMTEDMVSSMVKEIMGTYKIKYTTIDKFELADMIEEIRGDKKLKQEEKASKIAELEAAHVRDIDFTPPFRQVSMCDEVQRVLCEKFPEKAKAGLFKINEVDMNTEEARKHLDEVVTALGVEQVPPRTTARLLDTLVGEFVEPECISPTFICDHPEIMSPLAKYHRSRKGLTERFELFINGKELCNAYTELNDPFVQRERFEQQAAQKDAGDDEAMFIDHDFLKAMEYGLPPTGGWGMGIDRLCMFLTDNVSIREVLLFPAMKPIKSGSGSGSGSGAAAEEGAGAPPAASAGVAAAAAADAAAAQLQKVLDLNK